MNENQDFNTMDGPVLVKAYNAMAESTTGKELGAKPVARFADTKSGIARCEKLASSIKARKAGLSEAKSSVSDNSASTLTSKETTMAKTAKKKKVNTKKKKKNGKAPVAVAEDKRSKIGQEFDTRLSGTSNREKLLNAIYRKMVPVNQLLKAVYGSMNAENKGSLMMVMAGAKTTIKNKKLPYEIRKVKDAESKEISFGLYPK